MSVLIKGYEMPKDGCKDCAMVIRGQVFDICPFLRQEVNGNVERGGKPNGCPLIEVPDRNVGDMISRQAAIDELDKGAWGAEWDKALAQAMIESLPSAQPEQKSGKWIYDGVKRICPFCKDFIVTGRSIVKYCWNCGARLKERSEDVGKSDTDSNR